MIVCVSSANALALPASVARLFGVANNAANVIAHVARENLVTTEDASFNALTTRQQTEDCSDKTAVQAFASACSSSLKSCGSSPSDVSWSRESCCPTLNGAVLLYEALTPPCKDLAAKTNAYYVQYVTQYYTSCGAIDCATQGSETSISCFTTTASGPHYSLCYSREVLYTNGEKAVLRGCAYTQSITGCETKYGKPDTPSIKSVSSVWCCGTPNCNRASNGVSSNAYSATLSCTPSRFMLLVFIACIMSGV